MNAIQQWKVGRVCITRIVEGTEFAVDPSLLFPVSCEEVLRHDWLQPHFATPKGELLMAIQAFIIDTGSQRIIVDTCIGNDKQRHAPMWNKLQGPFLEDLAAAGYPPDSISTVICTHMHVDHVGWNTRWSGDRWVPTFRNARYLFSRPEWEHWTKHVQPRDVADTQQSEASKMMQTEELLRDSILPIADAGLHDLVECDHRLSDEVWLEPTPGHTPGHVSVFVSSEEQRAVITGDLMHHPFQCAQPEIGTHVDFDQDRSHKTRVDFLGRFADQDVLVFGTHFASPAAGHVKSSGTHSWRFNCQ